MTGDGTPLPPVASTPDPATVTLVASVVRSLLIIAGTLGLYHGAVSDSVATIIAGAIVVLAAAAWSLWQKFSEAKRTHAAAVRSSRMARPVHLAPQAVTPSGGHP
jgi:hypothetical protein